MSTFTDKRNFRKKTPEKIEVIPAQLGDGYGHLDYPGRPMHYYARVAGRLEVVFNDRVPAQYDLLVDVGRDTVTGSETPGIFKVLSTRSGSPAGPGGQVQAGYAPAKRYEWMAPGGGQDPLWVQRRQEMWLRTGVYLGMLVELWPGLVWNGTENKSIAFQTIDLSAHIPTTPGEAAFVLITIDIDGLVVDTKGDEFTLGDMTTADLMLANIPEAPADTAYISAAVRVYEGQTAVQEGRTNTDIIDLRHMNGGNSGTSDHEDLTGLLGGTTDEHYHLTETEYDDLLGNLDGGNSIAHFHESDRDRANHTGTQTSSTISDFANTVRATVLTGLSLATNQVIAATDNILEALGYLQAQITARIPSDGWISETHTWSYSSGGGSQAYTNDPAAGSGITLNMTSTSLFRVGDRVTVSSSAGSEDARIDSLITNTSITVNSLSLNHTTTSPLVTLIENTFIVSINADVTGILRLGHRVKITQDGGVKYFGVNGVGAYSGGATLITLFGGTDYVLTNSAITLPYFSPVKAPFGFSLDANKWCIAVSDANRCQKLTPTNGTWYGGTGLTSPGPSIVVPVGSWYPAFKALLDTFDTTVTDYNVWATLSNANNSEMDDKTTVLVVLTTPSGSYKIWNTPSVSRPLPIVVTTKETRYLNIKTTTSTSDNIDIRGDALPTWLYLVWAYL